MGLDAWDLNVLTFWGGPAFQKHKQNGVELWILHLSSLTTPKQAKRDNKMSEHEFEAKHPFFASPAGSLRDVLQHALTICGNPFLFFLLLSSFPQKQAPQTKTKRQQNKELRAMKKFVDKRWNAGCEKLVKLRAIASCHAGASKTRFQGQRGVGCHSAERGTRRRMTNFDLIEREFWTKSDLLGKMTAPS
jgi:hypothetical protein